ncbi:MAG: hypothetical protein C5B59_19055 [Bacteroidetes bacterium]|nr:MAG: hypothetical protein C5B59_19055 [Bacteroidota bacterium]
MRIQSSPREFNNKIAVEIISENEGHCIISLTNQKGLVRMMMGVNVYEGSNKIVVDKIDYLEEGAYQLEVKNIDSTLLYNSVLIKH